MVHNAEPHAEWPAVSTGVQKLIRQASERVLDNRDDLLAEFHAAELSSERMHGVAEDPALFAATRRASLADLLRWALANLKHPGARVPTISAAEATEIARDLVRSGLDERGLEAYRVAQNTAWRLWMAICFQLATDPPELHELLAVSWLSIAAFVDDTVAAVSAQMDIERAELIRGAQIERRAMVSLLLEGAQVATARAEAALGYPLRITHTAVIVWSDRLSAPGELEAVTEGVMRTAGASHRLTIAPNASTLWVWLPVGRVPGLAPLSDRLSRNPGVRVAFGRPAAGVKGFRRSHFDATATQTHAGPACLPTTSGPIRRRSAGFHAYQRSGPVGRIPPGHARRSAACRDRNPAHDRHLYPRTVQYHPHRRGPVHTPQHCRTTACASRRAAASTPG